MKAGITGSIACHGNWTRPLSIYKTVFAALLMLYSFQLIFAAWLPVEMLFEHGDIGKV
jgi:hypothetical protein